MRARDARFDGRFFTGVRTTGIYCRPICPARTPAARNTLFFPSAAAAEASGFRACRRCRPESAPGSPAWAGTAAVVHRAANLIEDGVLDETDVAGLAERVGLGPRHLRRLFREHIGVGPLRLARSRRAHFARRLLDADGHGSMSITQIAFASGFGSVRQFNHVMRQVFGASPRELRAGARGASTGVVLRLPVSPPYDFEWILRFLQPRIFPGVERVDFERGLYQRVLRVVSRGQRPAIGLVSVWLDGANLCVSVSPPLLPDVRRVARLAQRMFDTAADTASIGAHLRRSPRLADAVSARPGIRLPGAFDPFEIAVRAVLGQQVSVTAAATLARRLTEQYSSPLDVGRVAMACAADDRDDARAFDVESVNVADAPDRLFPDASVLAEAPLEGIGLVAARAETVRRIATRFRDDPGWFGPDRDLGQERARLRAIRGVGPWMESYVALRVGGDADAFPAGDLILRRVLTDEADASTISEAEAERRAEPMRPYRGYAAMHLWASYAGK